MSIEADFSQVLDLADGLREALQIATTGAPRVVREAADEMADNIRRDVVVATGELRDSTDVEYSGLSATVYTDARHDIYVEYGTAYMDAQPYMEPAAEDAEDDLAERVERLSEEAW